MSATEKKFKVELSGKELNYIWMALHLRIDGMKRGRQYGNIPDIIKFSEKVQRKLERLRKGQKIG